jgi:flagellar hook protein FlgE
MWSWTMWYTPNGVSPDADAAWQPAGPGSAPQAGAFVGDSSGLSLTGAGDFIASENRHASVTGNLAAVVFNADGSLADNGAVDPVTGLSPTNIAVPGQPVNPLNVQFGLNIPNGAVGPGGAAGMLTFSVNLGTPNDPPPPSITVPPTAPLPLENVGLRDGVTGDYGRGSFDALGNYTPNQTIFTSSVDGYSQGNLLGLQINIFGEIEGTFDNNKVVAVAALALTRFQNSEGLEKAGGNMFRQTVNSGEGQVGTAGKNGFGMTYGGQLENSNVDLTLELTNMILAQRMFESSARIVTAQDRVFDKLTELGR